MDRSVSRIVFASFVLSGVSMGTVAIAQDPIVPAQDALNTQVVQEGDRHLIHGGQLSSDQTNLFHGFERFNVPTGHTADFQASPQLRNILGRISGGEPSFIDGTLQVSGGNPNLFLLNPAGAVFGPNSQLNVPASFHFSTADQVQFGSGLGWEILGGADISVASLGSWNGDPTGFSFGNPASVINFGALAVMPGGDLTLLGGTVLNVGSLSAPGGTVTLAAVESGMVQLGSVDGVLSLEFQAAAIAPSDANFSPLQLPALLTGAEEAGIPVAEAVAVDGATGAVTLGQTRIVAEGGTAIASGTLSASSETGVGGTVNVLGDRVAVAGGDLTATGPDGGGLIQVGGGFQGNGLVWNAQNTSVDPLSRFDVSATQDGPGGTAIAWADGNTWFQGTAIARGGPLGGDGGLIETSGLQFLDSSTATIDASAPLGRSGTWLLDPLDLNIVAGLVGANFELDETPGDPITFSPTTNPGAASEITNGTIEANLNAGTSVTLTANRDISIQAPINANTAANTTLRLEADNDISVSQGITFGMGNNTVELVAGNSLNLGAPLAFGAGTNRVQLAAGADLDIDAGISTTAGTVAVEAQTTGNSATVMLVTGNTINTNGGDVSLTSTMGNVVLEGGSSVLTNGGSFSADANTDFSLSGEVSTSGGRVEILANDGIGLLGGTIQTAAGDLVLNGDRDGVGGGEVFLQSISQLETTTGNIDIDGEGETAGAGTNGTGVLIDGGSTVTAGSGRIDIDGVGGSGFTDTATGVGIVGGSTIAGAGAIAITGTGDMSGGDTAGSNQGILIDAGSMITATGTALTTITGTAGAIIATNHDGHGVTIDNGAMISVGQGGLNLTGTGSGTGSGTGIGSGSGTGHGINVNNGTLAATGTGNITLTGLGSPEAADNNHGVFVNDNGLIEVVNGTARLTGTGQGTGTNNSGVVLNQTLTVGGSLPTVRATGTGNVTLEGERGQGNLDNDGVSVGGLVSGLTGTLTLRSLNNLMRTPTDNGNDGVVIRGQRGLVQSDGGAIAITGMSGPGLDQNRGIAIENGGVANTGVSALGNGTITLTGTSTGTGTENVGVEVGGNLRIASGTATITGTSTAAPVGTFSADGVLSLTTGAIATSDDGSFTLTGTGSTAGVKLQSDVTNNNGNITLIGNGGTQGIQIEGVVETTGSGTLQATGTATSANGDGIFIDDAMGGLARATGTGDAIFDATGTGTGLDFNVAFVGASTDPAAIAAANTGLFSLTTARDLTLTTDRTFTGSVFLRSRTGTVAVQNLTSTEGALAMVSDQQNITYLDLDIDETIALTANQGFITGTMIQSGGNTRVRADGEVVVTGTITSGGYDARSESDRFQGTTITGSGPIRIFAQRDLTVGNITNPGELIDIRSETGQITAGDLSSTANDGGNITVRAQTQITTGVINSRGLVGDGGTVFVDPVGDVVIQWIDASGGAGEPGGDITVITTGGDLRFPGLVPNAGCAGASVCTTAGARVDLRHGGATAGGAPTFEVGDPTINGSAGTLTNGTSTIAIDQSLLSTPATSFVEGGVSVTPGQILTPVVSPPPPPPLLTTSETETDPNPGDLTTTPVPETPEPPTPTIAIDTATPIPDPEPTDTLTTPTPAPPTSVTPVPVTSTPLGTETPTSPETPIPVPVETPTTPLPTTPSNADSLVSETQEQVLQLAQRIRESVEPEQTVLEELVPKSADQADSVSLDFARQIRVALERGDISGAIAATDALRRYEFAAHAQDEVTTSLQGSEAIDNNLVERMQELVRTWEERTRQRYAILYTLSYPDRLELLLITRDGTPVHHIVPSAGQLILSDAASKLRQSITHPLSRVQGSTHLPASQELYDYIIRPVRDRLELDNIDSIIMSLSPELRSVPVAALHDGDRYLIEDYNFTLLPSFDAIDSQQKLERGSGVLAMGASEFSDPKQAPLPFVPLELETITQNSWQGRSFLNEAFNVENFRDQRQADPSAIVHLATHAEFKGGALDKSYIQFGQERIGLHDIGQLQLGNPVVNLLVLSACRTALGNAQAELGFAGLSVQSGARTAIASLWYVDDAGTSVLMSQFYRYWADGDIATKSAALQLAQRALLSGKATVENGQLIVKNNEGQAEITIPLPPDLQNISMADLRHPYYWSAFTAIGSPW